MTIYLAIKSPVRAVGPFKRNFDRCVAARQHHPVIMTFARSAPAELPPEKRKRKDNGALLFHDHNGLILFIRMLLEHRTETSRWL
jgi:hypothetical protein